MDPRLKIAIDFIMRNSNGSEKPVATQKVVDCINDQIPDAKLTKEGFQQQIKPLSRETNNFIGTSHRGIFLVTTPQDYKVASEFLERRMNAEKKNLESLKKFATQKGISC